MSHPKDSDLPNSDPKPQTSKRTLAIVYALVVLAFAVGLVITDGNIGPRSPAEPTLNELSSK